MSRRFAGAGLMRRTGARGDGAAVSLVNPQTDVPGLLYWWQISAATVTLNGSNVSAVTERIAGSANMSEATAAQQPAYNATGGPNNREYISLQDAARNIGATVSISAGHRVGMFAVVKALTASHIVASAHSTAARYQIGLDASSNYRHQAAFTGGTQNPAITSPANNSGWHIHAMLPLASGALSQIDRTTVTTNFTGTDTVQNITNVSFGFTNAIVCAGEGASIMMVDLTVNPTVAIAAVYAYYGQWYGL